MTSSEVTSVKGGFSTQKAAAATTTKKTEKAAEAFASLMNTAGGYAPVQNQTGKNKEQITVSASTDTGKSNTAQIRQASDPTTQIRQKLSDKQEAVGDDAKDIVEEELDVTEEEVNAAMETLGLTVFDLFDPENLAKLTMELTGTEDSSSLLMNEKFVDLMQQIGAFETQLADQLGVSIEDLQEFFAMEDVAADPQVAELVQEITADQELLQTQDVQLADEPVQTTQIAADTAMRQPDTETARTDVTMQEQPDTGEVEQNVTVEVTAETQSDTESEAQTGDLGAGEDQDMESIWENQPGDKTIESGHDQAATHIFGQVTEQTMQVQPQTTAPQVQTTVDVADIMNQIAEFARVNVSQDTSSIEMQLNPENLGKIYLQISTTKEGTVHAQLAAQNEAVKAALETQVAELRQTLNQQGVKVDAIEVTVASHEFEQNLEQHAESEKRQGEEQEQARPTRRSLSRESLDELSGLMSEEEVIAAQIMKDNGNSMDVIA